MHLDSCCVVKDFFKVPLGCYYISTRVGLSCLLLSFFECALLWCLSLKVTWKWTRGPFLQLLNACAFLFSIQTLYFFLLSSLLAFHLLIHESWFRWLNCRWNWLISITEAFFHTLLGIWWSSDYSITACGLPPSLPLRTFNCIMWEWNKNLNNRKWDRHLFCHFNAWHELSAKGLHLAIWFFCVADCLKPPRWISWLSEHPLRKKKKKFASVNLRSGCCKSYSSIYCNKKNVHHYKKLLSS